MDPDTEILGSGKKFQSTCWGLVRSAASGESLDQLIRIYWKPLYFYVRRKGYTNETAKDIVQEFLATLIERNALHKADPGRGRFRNFLLASMGNFILDWERMAGREKRGGGAVLRSLDFPAGEREFVQVAAKDLTPERLADLMWARAVFDQCLSELKGDPRHVEALRLRLEGEEYGAVCSRTGLATAAAQSAVHRLCKQFGEVLRAQLRPYSQTPEQFEDEISEFLSLISCQGFRSTS